MDWGGSYPAQPLLSLGVAWWPFGGTLLSQPPGLNGSAEFSWLWQQEGGTAP
jgi:hypothetical protein